MYTKVASNSDMPISNTAFDRIALDARRRAERRRGAARRDERDGVAGLERQRLRPAAGRWRRRSPSSKSSSVPCRMLPAICSILLQVLGAHAAHQHAAAAILRRAERLPLHQRNGALDARHRGDAVGDLGDNRSAGCRCGATKIWPLMPTILSSSSLRKPFMTDSTTISVATPSMMPRNEKPAMTETKPSRRRVRR